MLNKPGESWRIQALVSMMERAHGESARKSDMIGQVRARERQEEAAGLKKHKRTPPGWIEWDDEAQDYRLHPIHAPTIRRVFELAGEGLAQYQIARRLMEENYAPVYGGTFWNTSYISKLLDDDRVLGVYQPHKLVDGERVPEGEPLQGYYPELVTPEMFARAQAHRVVPNHRGGYSQSYANLFSGFCHCAECGWPMQLKTVHK